jgi:pterin-4a-carbinolamine dehydratase
MFSSGITGSAEFEGGRTRHKKREINKEKDHHPDWSNAYNRITIDLSTHSAGGITENDFELASKIQKIHGQ